MKNLTTITCPVSSQKVNENVVRLVAFEVVTLTLLSLLLQSYFIAAFLTLDFALRAFRSGNGSLLKYIGKHLNRVNGNRSTPVNAAPKKFAASIGVVFSGTITVLLILKLSVPAIVVGTLLITAALLEGIFAFCVGCVIYSLLIRFKR